LTLKIHQRPPGATHCQLAVFRVESSTPESFEKNSVDFRFVAAVAAFGMKLRHSPDAANIAWTKIEQIAAGSLGADPDGQRSDFAKLVAKASRLENSGVSMLLSKAPFFALSFLP
jgi:Ca-activated chloride channel family protein